jgi:hypothetical protein
MGSLVRSPSKIVHRVVLAVEPVHCAWSIRLTLSPPFFCGKRADGLTTRANQHRLCAFGHPMSAIARLIVLKNGIVRPILAIFIAEYLP